MRALSLLLITALAACSQDGDFGRPGTWVATGVNDRNLNAMLVDRSHAARGIEARDSRGNSGTAAVDRLLRDRLRPLPAANQVPALAGAGAAPPAAGGPNAR
ncbi:hypothetical protein J8J14_10910 [Roseomonas sp. SSH11]|uniref:Lipoprotein n=1 Tax=Pararoseomonas baculiformis TaxID=2820812 RepID=A0ABS4AE54_9PROT|nr:hypothetical protein [Pararoseomonas baculiformis]MBP0445288.1 hypothetical protein [Pararoseomonas baculiformis]